MLCSFQRAVYLVLWDSPWLLCWAFVTSQSYRRHVWKKGGHSANVPSPKANERARKAAGCVCAKAGGLDDHNMETAGHRRPCLLDHQRHHTELPEQDMLEQGERRRNGTQRRTANARIALQIKKHEKHEACDQCPLSRRQQQGRGRVHTSVGHHQCPAVHFAFNNVLLPPHTTPRSKKCLDQDRRGFKNGETRVTCSRSTNSGLLVRVAHRQCYR